MGLRDRLHKATAPKGGRDISPLVAALTAAMSGPKGTIDRTDSSLARPEDWITSEFGPGWPISPEPLDKPGEGGWVEPRIYEYPVAWNLPGQPGRRVVPWETLRKAAESPLIRVCIETRKRQIEDLDWAIRPSKRILAKRAKDTGRSKNTIEREIRDKYRDEMDRIESFWEMPDRRNGRNFRAWTNLLLEEQLTWDAVAIYPRRTYGGDLSDLILLDGSTIKPLLDQQGGRPEAPAPAYQQVLYAFPRGEFTADTVDVEGKLLVPGGLSASQLIYERRVHRAWTPYGFSPVEQALLDNLLWQKRFHWMLAEYTDGVAPQQWLTNKGEIDWTPRQLLEYERQLNDRLSGKTEQRMRNPLLPPGIEPVNSPANNERYKPDYDLFVLKLLAAHFDITVNEFGFVEPGGLGASGFHEGQQDINYRRGVQPTSRWLNDMLTRISISQLGMPPELEFAFLGLEEEDEAAADMVAENRVKSGRMTLNEDRARNGLPAYDFDEADMPMQQTARGVVFIQGASESVPAGVLVEPASEVPAEDGAPGTASGAPGGAQLDTQSGNAAGAKGKTGQSPSQRRPIKPGGGPKPVSKEALDELARFHRWAAKGRKLDRPFRFEHLSEELAADVAPELLSDERAVFKAAGAGPKASSPSSSSASASPSWSLY